MEQHQQRLQRLIDKYLKGESSPEESEMVEQFFESFSSRPDILDQLSPEQQQAIKKRIQGNVLQHISPPQSRRMHFRNLAAAAALVLCFMTICYLYLFSGSNKNTDIHLANGQQQHITLTDGTQITLNASSRIIYPNSFKDSAKREVTLIGEAFFDVAKDPKKPFIIHTPRMQISVLGTAFNVRDYANEPNAETALVRGKVSIWKTGAVDQKFILRPKEKFVISSKTNPETPAAAEASRALAAQATVAIKPFLISDQDGSALETEWLLKRITIQEETLASIALKLERMYGVKIQISSRALATQRYSATFENEELDNILKALQTVHHFQIKKTGKDQLQLF
ncbi:FecR domain-containing protein [Sphingobacterium sp. N143]|uniref:FecR family protein n=1 Tax=Sphingobacterium sp. N143 TaxID=2746727 RepID=UPI0025777AB6|nr:FecR domain-containing protein [Sphingobacterium sp. N143]MDM1295809.1 FecR domain-containing protein [Sphingobacterium sp. N143]